MEQTLSYRGRSALRGEVLGLASDAGRPPVAFDAPLRQPVRFREAISTLHAVVVSDLRHQKRDKSRYKAWLEEQRRREGALREEVRGRALQEVAEAAGRHVPRGLELSFKQALARYWKLRRRYEKILWKEDPGLWRKLMPYDPVISVAEDAVLFEAFSRDESSYGCLSVDRPAYFPGASGVQLGTTNVDYSAALYEHFQSLRSYRETRFRLAPDGFDVATAGAGAVREAKIELPDGWLRGFMQMQAAAALPLRKVSLDTAAVYAILAWLQRHKAKKSPRALRFELYDGQAPRVVLEPWEKPIASPGTRYAGPDGAPIRVWGRRRLLSLARLLPLAERVGVYLLGTGLPSFWVARLGDMRFSLGLSGWTTNDWTRCAALDQLAPPAAPSVALVERVAVALAEAGRADLDSLAARTGAGRAELLAALHRLARGGRAIFDLGAGVYRSRQLLNEPLDITALDAENPELAASRGLLGRVCVGSDSSSSGGRAVGGQVGSQPVELLLDGDGRIKRGRCRCSHHFRFGLRAGPCRHLLALRTALLDGIPPPPGLAEWLDGLLQRAGR